MQFCRQRENIIHLIRYAKQLIIIKISWSFTVRVSDIRRIPRNTYYMQPIKLKTAGYVTIKFEATAKEQTAVEPARAGAVFYVYTIPARVRGKTIAQSIEGTYLQDKN